MKPAQTSDIMQARLDEIEPRLRQLLGILNMRLPQTQGLTIADAMFQRLQQRALQESASNAISLRDWLVKHMPGIWREYHSAQERLPSDSADIFRCNGTVTVPFGVNADEFKAAYKRGLTPEERERYTAALLGVEADKKAHRSNAWRLKEHAAAAGPGRGAEPGVPGQPPGGPPPGAAGGAGQPGGAGAEPWHL